MIQLPQNELSLLREVADYPELNELTACTVDAMRDMAAIRGIDFATALLYDRVIRSARHGPFIQRVNTLINAPQSVTRYAARIVIVPGAFHCRYPQSGADGRFVREAAEQLGCDAHIIPLPDFSSVRENARQINEWLAANTQAESPVLLVSLSKGGSDVKLAMSLPDAPAAFSSVAAWVNLSGILNGTPLAAWLFSNGLRSRWTRFLLRCRGYDLEIVRELDRRTGGLLDAPLPLPPHMRAMHVVGFPLRAHATNRLARRNHRRLAPFGPNDGAGILLADACVWPGYLYPVWAADHYLRPVGGDMNQIAVALLREALATPREHSLSCV
jgi:hypothetical protein